MSVLFDQNITKIASDCSIISNKQSTHNAVSTFSSGTPVSRKFKDDYDR